MAYQFDMVQHAGPGVMRGANSATSKTRRALLLSVGSVALLAAAPRVMAAEFTNNGASGNYGDASTWASGGAPTPGDTSTITGGTITVGGQAQAGIVNLVGGHLTSDPSDSLTATDFFQTGGTMSGNVVATNYDISGGAVSGGGWLEDYDPANRASISIDEAMTISGDAIIENNVWIVAHGASPAIVTQDGGTMNGVVSEIWREPYVTAYYLKNGVVGVDARIFTGDLIVQSGGIMDGHSDTWTYQLSGGSTGGYAWAVDLDLSDDGTLAAGALVDLVHTFDMTGGTVEHGAEIVFESGWLADGDDINGLVRQSGGAMDGSITAATYRQSGGSLGEDALVEFSDLFDLSGDAVIEHGAQIVAGESVINTDDGAAPTSQFTQSGGTMNGTVTADIYTHTGGALGGSVTTGTYELNDADATSTAGATIDASTAFTLSPATGTAVVDARLTGSGTLIKSGAGTVVLGNSANDFSGGVSIDEGTLQTINDALTDNAAVTIATDATLAMMIDDNITTTFGGTITGADGRLVKDGGGTLNLTGDLIIGDIAIDDGTLHVKNDALNNTDAVSVADDATLQVTVDSGESVMFNGVMTGANGELIKDGDGALTLGGSVYLGALGVNAGWLNIGNGISADEASFDSAVIESGATVYVANGATLTIRVPNNIVNNGFLINDGTVHDDLDNNAIFNNNNIYNAQVASNTGTINNNMPGVWTGDIITNAGRIENKTGASWTGAVNANIGIVNNVGTWVGDVNGNGTAGYWPIWTYGLVHNDKGAVWTGDVVENEGSIRNIASTWNGDVIDNHNNLMNDNSADELDLGYWNGDVIANHGLVFNAGGGIWTGDVLSNDGRVLSDRASHHTVATDNSEWHGDVVTNAGQVDGRAFWYGDVRGNAGVVNNNGWWQGDIYAGNTGAVYNAQDNYGIPVYDTIRPTWTGDVVGNSGTIRNLGADWTGDIAANTGTISNSGGSFNGFQLGGSTWTGNILTNAGMIANALDSTWTGDVLSNTGTIRAAGIWNGSITNSVSGLFELQGALTGIGTLTNGGTLDLRSGGAAQALTVTTANLQAGSTFSVAVDAAGNTQKLVATSATLGGTVNVTVNPIVGNSDYTKTYTILEATNRTGTFAGTTTDLAFLAPQLDYATPGQVDLTLVENNRGFDTVAVTDNQRAAAAAIDALGNTSPIYQAILGLTSAEAEDAFDQLSGASQNSIQTADLQAASLVSQVIAGRVNQSFDAIGSGDGTVSNYAGAAPLVANPSPTTGIWGQLYGAYGSVATTPSMAGMNSTTGGLAAGIDGELGDWRLGVAFDAGGTGTRLPDLNTSSSSFDYGFGLYGGGEFGNTRLSMGAHYTRHAISSIRNVSFPGFNETLTADYDAGTAQAFGQISQEFEFGASSVTPYAGLQYAANATDGHTETGGAAALTTAANLVDATFATLGFNASHKFVVGHILLTADGGLGWRHGFVNAPGTVQSIGGGPTFTVVGAPLPADTAVVTAGLNLDISPTMTFNLRYDGQVATGVETHGLSAAWNGKF